MPKDNGTKPAKPAKTPKAKGEKKSFVYGLKKYFRDLKAEFKKVVWPTKQQVVKNTSIVLITMILAGIFIWGLDSAFTQILRLVIGA
ncbi:MAG: preprotein translocase subunit SecE [Clostridiales bacterium]|jgi:preprotein translocase subunit SecE|nr:preprotein translocase, SecE subunit, bacterial [Oscillospiraceae bacterium]MDN5377809.1 preprotein translocase subunit SecE [Clostridiales bacterium]